MNGSIERCRKALDVMAENTGMLPRDLDIEEMRRDLTAHDALNTRLVRLQRVLEKATTPRWRWAAT